MLLVDDDEEDGNNIDQLLSEVELDVAEVESEVEVSLNSVVGFTTLKTMKLKAMIGGQEVVILIDSGNTRNVISLELVKRQQLPVQKTSEYGVTMGSCTTVQRQGVCKGVTLQLQGVEVVIDFLSLELGSSNVILDIQWLEILGVI